MLFKYGIKDRKKRYKFKRKELQFRIFKYLFESDITLETKYWIYYKYLKNKPGNYSITSIKNRCILTDRSRSPKRFVRLSRLALQSKVSAGLCSGIGRCTW